MEPGNVVSDPVHQRLTELREGLLELHRVLLESERAVYERDVQKITSPTQMLSLLMNDPWFDWLHDVSMFVAQIDEALDAEEPVQPVEAERMIARAKALIRPSEEGQGFEKRYFEAIQRDPNVIFAHRDISTLLQRLSQPSV